MTIKVNLITLIQMKANLDNNRTDMSQEQFEKALNGNMNFINDDTLEKKGVRLLLRGLTPFFLYKSCWILP
jgi:hypothetical protein